MAHNGTRLGQVLFLVCNRLNVVRKVSAISCITRYHLTLMQVGHITCDNASNNTTMLQEFARCYYLKTGSTFDVDCRHIRCAVVLQAFKPYILFIQMHGPYHQLGHTSSHFYMQQGQVLLGGSRRRYHIWRRGGVGARWSWTHQSHLRKGMWYFDIQASTTVCLTWTRHVLLLNKSKSSWTSKRVMGYAPATFCSTWRSSGVLLILCWLVLSLSKTCVSFDFCCVDITYTALTGDWQLHPQAQAKGKRHGKVAQAWPTWIVQGRVDTRSPLQESSPGAPFIILSISTNTSVPLFRTPIRCSTHFQLHQDPCFTTHSLR